jgi:hypothetical protein
VKREEGEKGKCRRRKRKERRGERRCTHSLVKYCSSLISHPSVVDFEFQIRSTIYCLISNFALSPNLLNCIISILKYPDLHNTKDYVSVKYVNRFY